MRFSLFVLVVAWASIHATAQNAAWFGTPVPPPLSDPRKPIMKHDDAFAPLPVPFVRRPGRHDELLDGTALKADHKRIVGFSLESLASGDKVWGRRAATPAFMHTLEWTLNEFKAVGLKDPRIETYSVPGSMWVPQSWKIEIVGDPAFGADTSTVTLQSAFPQPGGVTIQDGSLTAPGCGNAD